MIVEIDSRLVIILSWKRGFMYFDYASTSIKRKDILEKLIDNIDDYNANPSSIHSPGKKTKSYLNEARNKLADEINTDASKIYFTSGATEANNWLVKNFDDESIEIISSNIEHKSILESLNSVKSKIKYIKADKKGRVSLDQVKAAITDKTRLVILMLVNNETGIIQPVKEIGQYLKDKDIWFHVDGVQALGHLDIDVEDMCIDSLALSGHKIGGLNGFGVLYSRERLKPLINGGGQESGIRAGSSNTLAALSMAYSLDSLRGEREKILELKEYFLENLKDIDHEINGDVENSVNHIVNIYFPFVKSDLLLTYLDLKGIYISAGSACNANALEPSYVIENIYDKERAKHSVRFSFGYTNTKEEIDQLIYWLNEMYKKKKKD